MQYREDKRSGASLSALGFGCMRLPGLEKSEKLILAALEKGINYFDTAYAYSGNEEMLGKIIARNGIRDKMLIATKLPTRKTKTVEDAERMFSTSLQRLQTDHVEYFLFHNIVTFDEWERLQKLGIEDWVSKQKENGRIQQVGFSFHGAMPEFEKVFASYDWDFVQIQYNFVNEYYQAGRSGLELAEQKGIPVIIMEPLLGGKLADGMPKDAAAVLKKADPEASVASWGLRWLWDQPGVTCVLSGMNAMEQLEDNIAIASNAGPGCLDEQQHQVIADCKAVFEKAFKVPCTGCNYCMPCPKGISIPSAFAAYNESYSINWFTGIFQYAVSIGISGNEPRWSSNCINCGACVKACPQHIDIPAELKRVRRRLEPGVFKPASKILRLFV